MAPLGLSIASLPMSVAVLEELLAAAPGGKR